MTYRALSFQLRVLRYALSALRYAIMIEPTFLWMTPKVSFIADALLLISFLDSSLFLK